MSEGPATRIREALSQRRVRALLVLIGVLLVGALVVSRLPRPVAGVGTLDQCLGGWPVVAFEGEDWKAALPDDLRTYAPRSLPIAAWPSGVRFEEASGVLFDAHHDPLFQRGERMRIRGSVVEVLGDPSPCYYTLGLKVEEISRP